MRYWVMFVGGDVYSKSSLDAALGSIHPLDWAMVDEVRIISDTGETFRVDYPDTDPTPYLVPMDPTPGDVLRSLIREARAREGWRRVKPTAIAVGDIAPGVFRFPSRSIKIKGAGTVRDVVFVSDETMALRVKPSESVGSWIRPFDREPKESETITFESCEFRGLKIGRFEPSFARFINCVFRDVDVVCNPASVGAHFINCTFSGRWVGNFDAEDGVAGDPYRRMRFEGNDFRELDGWFVFFGVREDLQKFSLGVNHIIVRREHIKAIERLDLADDPLMADDLLKVRYYGWHIFTRRSTEAAEWDQLLQITGQGI